MLSKLPFVSIMKWPRRRFSEFAHLPRKDRVELIFRHPVAGQSPHALGGRRSADHDDDIDGGIASALEQQGHVDDHEPPPFGRSPFDKAGPGAGDRRMHQIFEALKGRDVGKYKERKPLPIDPAFDEHAGENLLDRLRSVTGIEFAHCGVGVENRRPEPGEDGGDGRFPHRDRTRQTGDDQIKPPRAGARLIRASTKVKVLSANDGRLSSPAVPVSKPGEGSSFRSGFLTLAFAGVTRSRAAISR